MSAGPNLVSYCPNSNCGLGGPQLLSDPAPAQHHGLHRAAMVEDGLIRIACLAAREGDEVGAGAGGEAAEFRGAADGAGGVHGGHGEDARRLERREIFPALKAQRLLAMTTVNAARAIGRPTELGRLAPGSCADLIAVPRGKKRDVWQAVLDHRGDVTASMVRGCWV